jgi:L-methionine (R)-S-oxide reductase
LKYALAEQKIKTILLQKDTSNVMQQVVDFLQKHFRQYNWVGIYVVQNGVLVLGPWRGKEATEHTRIPIGRGVCGSAAQSGNTEIVDDVSKDNRYLSCFLSTRSEIVVPIKKGIKVVGEIDIDSDVFAAFDKNDAVFLEKIADMLRQHI